MNVDLLRKATMVMNGVWVVLALSFLVPGAEWAATLRLFFAVLLLVHAVEFLIFQRTLASLGGSTGHHFVRVLLYGLFHVQLAKAEAGDAPGE